MGTGEPDSSPSGDAASDVTTAADVVDAGGPTDAGQDTDTNVTDSGSSCVGKGGATAVPVEAGFCIDRTEVTNGAYAQFLATTPDAAAQSAECAWNTTFVATGDWPPSATGQNVPIDYVDCAMPILIASGLAVGSAEKSVEAERL